MTRVAMFIAAVLLMLVAAWQWSQGQNGGGHHSVATLSNPASAGGGENSGSATPPTAPPIDPLVPPLVLPGITPEPGIRPSTSNIAALLEPFEHDDRAHFHAHGEKVCASGCATSNHPTEPLSVEHFQQLLARYSVEPMEESSLALESLLYFGRQTRKLLDQYGNAPLDPVRSALLDQELERTFALIEIRVLDEAGEVRSWLPATRVPLDRRHEFDMEVHDVQRLITSGTVKRVGLDHLWTRL